MTSDVIITQENSRLSTPILRVWFNATSPENTSEVFERIRQHIEQYEPVYMLLDLSSDQVWLTPKSLDESNDLANKYFHKRGRIAIVVKTALGKMLTETVIEKLEHKLAIRVFQDMQEAGEWLSAAED